MIKLYKKQNFIVGLMAILRCSQLLSTSIPDEMTLMSHPKHIHMEILTHVGSNDLRNITQVNKQFNDCMAEDQLWFIFCQKAKFISPIAKFDSSRSYKNLYKFFSTPSFEIFAPFTFNNCHIAALSQDAQTLVYSARHSDYSENHSYVLETNAQRGHFKNIKSTWKISNLLAEGQIQNFAAKSISDFGKKITGVMINRFGEGHSSACVLHRVNDQNEYNIVYLESDNNINSFALNASSDGHVIVGTCDIPEEDVIRHVQWNQDDQGNYKRNDITSIDRNVMLNVHNKIITEITNSLDNGIKRFRRVIKAFSFNDDGKNYLKAWDINALDILPTVDEYNPTVQCSDNSVIGGSIRWGHTSKLYLWIKNTTHFSLESYIAQKKIMKDSVRLNEIQSISENGVVIAGTATQSKDKRQVMFRATIPASRNKF